MTNESCRAKTRHAPMGAGLAPASSGQLAVVIGLQMGLKSCLQFQSKPVQVDQIDAAIHVTETVRRTDDRVSRTLEYVAVRYPNTGYAREVLLPRLNHLHTNVAQLKQDFAHVNLSHTHVLLRRLTLRYFKLRCMPSGITCMSSQFAKTTAHQA